MVTNFEDEHMHMLLLGIVLHLENLTHVLQMAGLYRVFVSDRVWGLRESECLEFRMLEFSGFEV